MDLSALRYAKSHEWAKLDGDVVTVGITAYAAEQLGDVTHLQLPKVGTATTPGKAFGEIESVKAVFDLYAPVAGEVAEVNTALANSPEPVQSDPYGNWMIRINLAPGATLDHLMTKDQYDQQLASEGH
ncbi:MAG: glycine cleavage system protein GcvH [Gemmataceae bacterium]